MADVFCTDCGSECALVDGSEVRPRDPALDGSRVWLCPHCPDSFAKHIEARGGPGDPPSGSKTKAARVLLYERKLEPLLEQAVKYQKNSRDIAKERILGWLADKLELPNEPGLIGRLGIEQLQWAWTHLGHTTYADVRTWALREKPKRRSLA